MLSYRNNEHYTWGFTGNTAHRICSSSVRMAKVPSCSKSTNPKVQTWRPFSNSNSQGGRGLRNLIYISGRLRKKKKIEYFPTSPKFLRGPNQLNWLSTLRQFKNITQKRHIHSINKIHKEGSRSLEFVFCLEPKDRVQLYDLFPRQGIQPCAVPPARLCSCTALSSHLSTALHHSNRAQPLYPSQL